MSEGSEGPIKGDPHKEIEQKAVDFEFKDVDNIEEYLTWKQEVPLAVRRIVESAMKGTLPTPSQNGLPLTDQFLDTLGACIREKQVVDLERVNLKVANFLRPFSQVGTKGGYIDICSTLASYEASWKLKQIIYETQIRPALEWLADRDIKDLSKTIPEPSSFPSKGEQGDKGIPPTSEETISSMEAGAEQREGQPAVALFSVKPFQGRYFEQLVFNRFNPTTLRWEKETNEFTEAVPEDLDPLSVRIYYGKIRGGEPLALPTPDDWVFDPQNLEIDAPEGTVEVLRNQQGRWYLQVNSEGIFHYQLHIGRKSYLEEEEKCKEAEMGGDLPDELKTFVEEMKRSRLPKMKIKREIVKYVRNHLTYSNSREAWEYYSAKPKEYFTRIWERREADCKVANDLAARALCEIDLDVEYVAGFYVKEQGEQGEAVLHAGNGHAWLKVWDHIGRRFVKVDATPKGDPTIDEAEQERDLEGQTREGDYANPEEEIASEADAKKQLKHLEKQSLEGREKKKTQYGRNEECFAELANCTPEQAREFLKALERVREIKDEHGVPISDLMKEEWRKIVEERKVELHDYRGPVKMDQGDRLEDPVSATIDIRSGEFNPTGFEKDEIIEETQTDFGGLNIYFSFDLSGTMGQPDEVSGRIKADVQRDVGLLFVDSLMQCAYIARQAGTDSDLLPIKIMVTLARDRGEVKLPLTDKWGEKEQWIFYSALTKLAIGGTPTHETLELIEKDFLKEIDNLETKRISSEKFPVQYTAEISDGVPDDFDATEQMHKKLKDRGMVVRSYVIGGTSASEDAAPPLASFSELPKILAKDIITQFKKLRPRKVF